MCRSGCLNGTRHSSTKSSTFYWSLISTWQSVRKKLAALNTLRISITKALRCQGSISVRTISSPRSSNERLLWTSELAESKFIAPKRAWPSAVHRSKLSMLTAVPTSANITLPHTPISMISKSYGVWERDKRHPTKCSSKWENNSSNWHKWTRRSRTTMAVETTSPSSRREADERSSRLTISNKLWEKMGPPLTGQGAIIQTANQRSLHWRAGVVNLAPRKMPTQAVYLRRSNFKASRQNLISTSTSRSTANMRWTLIQNKLLHPRRVPRAAVWRKRALDRCSPVSLSNWWTKS